MTSDSDVDFRELNILLVEDELTDALLIMQAFRDSGFHSQLHHVRDGEEALDYLFRRRRYAGAPSPDLVLLDLNIPLQSGHEVLEHLRADAELQRKPVVIFTTSSAPLDVERAYGNYANTYIVKPHDFEGYSAVVKAVEEFWMKVAELPPR